MNRIEQTFDRLKKRGEKALVGFVTAGDPDIEKSIEIVTAMMDGGVDILELGVPFSDPSADGPVIQRASKRALTNRITLDDVLDMAARLRERTTVPIIIFTYYNPLFTMGPDIFCRKALRKGVDGVLIVDLPFEESGEILKFKESENLDFISLIAPVTPVKRMEMITASSSGFIYLISKTGITGSSGLNTIKTGSIAEKLRSVTDIPICTGFGISTPDHVRAVASFSDGVVIGSAFVKIIEDNLESPELSELIRQATVRFKKSCCSNSEV